MDSVTLLEITSVVIMEGLSMCFFRFTGGVWASLTQAGGSWEVRVKGDLSIRPDTNSINSSPVTGMLPIVRVQHGCPSAIHIPGTLVILLVKDGRLQGASHPPPPPSHSIAVWLVHSFSTGGVYVAQICSKSCMFSNVCT